MCMDNLQQRIFLKQMKVKLISCFQVTLQYSQIVIAEFLPKQSEFHQVHHFRLLFQVKMVQKAIQIYFFFYHRRVINLNQYNVCLKAQKEIGFAQKPFQISQFKVFQVNLPNQEVSFNIYQKLLPMKYLYEKLLCSCLKANLYLFVIFQLMKKTHFYNKRYQDEEVCPSNIYHKLFKHQNKLFFQA
ncbi:hypothetical protein TTHERM_000348108 (macronuclear) [Tetrahymena thermophila SB210]|uniref:Uncharacterized protein n=1 Tax=Tetrahymena thermophila (strain SB210) TaxID=312017 RepID=W7X4Z9_TETTS|nr:hypothetical protein TTHERM_000348108 [Tetrahymena thermophila SB210]EWS72492.1 hypothetical protein TTHERM_000348108 [Tetrahymena thermophila SB210]|eukprot:XP_012654989.1 hypothetical protein TTHERM_000348108 [Tetrahymena thermophila SB210]